MSKIIKIPGPKKVVLDLNTKVKVIEARKNDNLPVKEIMKLFNIGKTQVYDILKDQYVIIDRWHNCGNGNIKKSPRRTGNEEINRLVWEWIVAAKAKHFLLSGPIVQEHAKEIAQKLGNTTFKASNGWLERFRKRHLITFKEVWDEPDKTNQVTVAEWIDKLSSITEGYDPCNIASGSLTGLFFRALPNKTLCLREEKCSVGNLATERLTVFLCGFMNGEMETPLVIGREKKPKCFKNLNLYKLPVEWKSNDKVWMTSQLMEEWLYIFNKRMKQQNRYVLLFLDNAICHLHINLSNIQLAWFPPSICRPMDLGMIRCFKLNYRKLLLKSLLANMETSSPAIELPKPISILNAVNWIAESVNQIPRDVIKKGFRKAGFSTPHDFPNLEDFDDKEDQELQNYLNKAAFGSFKGESYLNIDKNLQTEAVIKGIDDLITICRDEEETVDIKQEIEISNSAFKNYKDILKVLRDIQDFSLQQNDCDLFNLISKAQLVAENQAVQKINLMKQQ